MTDINKLWDYLVEGMYFTDDEIRLVVDINGYSIETLNDCIYARYGFRSWEQMTREEEEEEEDI